MVNEYLYSIEHCIYMYSSGFFQQSGKETLAEHSIYMYNDHDFDPMKDALTDSWLLDGYSKFFGFKRSITLNICSKDYVCVDYSEF